MSPSMGKGGSPNPTMTEATRANDSDETSERPTISQQYSFSVGEDGEIDGEIEPAEETVETDLGTWGADLDHRERESRQDKPEASSFGVDDRPEVTTNDGGEQGALFADTADDQRTLTGERAGSQCLFDTDDTDEQADTEPAPAPTDEATTSRPVVTDGGETVEAAGSQMNENEGVMVAIPRLKLATVADYLGYERRTVERHGGEGAKTQELSQYVEECRSALSVLDDTDNTGSISRVVAAGAADVLDESAERHCGDVREELRELASVLREALDEQPASDDREEEKPVRISWDELADVANALDAERETIERNAGKGPKTETLARLVEKCRFGLLYGI
jgi:hypothetical protein